MEKPERLDCIRSQHDPAPPQLSHQQVPVMLDYIIAKVLAKARKRVTERGPILLRRCGMQATDGNGQQGAGPALLTPAPIPVVPQGAAAPIGLRILEVNRRRGRVGPLPTKGISRAFDSQKRPAPDASDRRRRETSSFRQSISGTRYRRDGALRRDSVRGTARKTLILRRNGGRGAGPCDDDRPGVSAGPRRRPARGGKMTVFLKVSMPAGCSSHGSSLRERTVPHRPHHGVQPRPTSGCGSSACKGTKCISSARTTRSGAPIMLAAGRGGGSRGAIHREIAKGPQRSTSRLPHRVRQLALDPLEWRTPSSRRPSIRQALQGRHDLPRRPSGQFYDPVKEMFLADRYIKGECPNCGAKDQYGDACENCSTVYPPTSSKSVLDLSGCKPCSNI